MRWPYRTYCVVVIVSLGGLLAGCAGTAPEGLQETATGQGPVVKWNLQVRPLPEIPFPNDAALRIDLESPTEKRINVSRIAPTEVESEFRRRATRVDGFGTFAPITVAFDAPLDVKSLKVDRDKAVLLIDVTKGSPTYGESHALDFGDGHYPVTIPRPNAYFRHDPRKMGASLILETEDEDLNGNGVLDPGEDVDGDNVLDKPNVLNADDSPWDGLMSFYERETNTLIVRPVVPLRQGTRYAVVLTKQLRGENGESVRSPFPYVTPANQTDYLETLKTVLPNHDVDPQDIAFAWTFTTQSITLDLETIRAGLYGHGTMSWLADRFPAQLKLDELREPQEGLSAYVVAGDELTALTSLLAVTFGVSAEMQASLTDSLSFVSHLVWGSYQTPSFLNDKDGLSSPYNPQNDDESWEIDPLTGEADYMESKVTFVCAIPKPLPGQEQPYPVVLHTTGTAAPKLVALGFAGYHARQGLATCAIDPFGQGFAFPPGSSIGDKEFTEILANINLAKALPSLKGNRARDLDNDGHPDSGGDFWSPDPFHSRDTVRQTVVDWMQFVRILRSFDGKRLGQVDIDNDGTNEIAGDFDRNGVPDFGTEDAVYSAWGISLGGIVTATLAGIEPKLSAAVPQSGGGGMTDIAMRSLQTGVPQMVVLGSWSQMVAGTPTEDGTELSLMVGHMTKVEYFKFATVKGIQPGDQVIIQNLRSGESGEGWVQPDGGFRVNVAADAFMPSELRAVYKLTPVAEDFEPLPLPSTKDVGDTLELCIYSPTGEKRKCVNTFEHSVTWAGVVYPEGQPLVAVQRGLGLKRQSPGFRRLVTIAQSVLEPADPINWAKHYHMEPLSYPYDPNVTPGCNVLNLLTVGDPNVPVAAGISLSRAAGMLSKAEMQSLIDNYVVEGMWRTGRHRTDGSFHPVTPKDWDPKTHEKDIVLFDIDDLDDGTDGFNAPSREEGPLRATVDTPTGKAGLRLLHIRPRGNHGVGIGDPSKAFPADMYGVNLITRFMATGGADLPHDRCLATNDCPFLIRDDAATQQ